ncbi:hypothetical protein [Dyella japonica]|uniref:hypothetical protein n=1 Tax=Dyella japonica TaxID=231455 RepID=UPI001186249C|nr:hypothetical protein [Dyella japonica]
MKMAILFGTLILLAGCADHFVAPTSGPVAEANFAAAGLDHGATILVQNFDNESCAPSRNGTRLATFTTTAIQGKGDSHDGVARTIPAGKPAIFTYAYNDGSSGVMDKTCSITESFVPTAGARYLVKFHKLDKTCDLSVTRQDGNDPKAVEGLHQVKPICLNGLTG